jgi:DNA-binding response OmpR family regulator
MRRHVLIVDDDPDTEALCVPYLESHDSRVTTASSDVEALEVVVADPPDIVLLDVEAPQSRGFALLETLRAERYDMPVLVFTARDSSRMRKLAEELGVCDILIKPLFPNELLRRITAALDHLTPVPGLIAPR